MLEKDKAAADKAKMGGVVEEASASRNMEEKLRYIPELRKISRAKYLELREEQQLDLFKRRLEDEQRVFGDQPLTEIERRLNELNRKLYGLAERRREKEKKGQGY